MAILLYRLADPAAQARSPRPNTYLHQAANTGYALDMHSYRPPDDGNHTACKPATLNSTSQTATIKEESAIQNTSGEILMSEHTPKTATSLLQAVSNGHPNAVNELLPLVYDELRHMAAAYLQTERPDHTLQPTALLHEAFLKLIDQRTAGWQDRGQFFGVAAKAMRRILVDHARTKRRAKREGNRKRIPLDTAVAYLEQQASDLLMLDEALDKLAIFDQRKARVVELRFFVGLSVDDTAQVLSVSRRTVEREWTLAKAWLKGEISGEKAHDA